MKHGNWVPVDKRLARCLPRGRAFSEVEAVFSLQLDLDAGKPVTLSGYSALWRWGKGRVIRFLEELGVRIEYPEPTGKRQNQAGHLTIIERTDNGLISDRKRTDNGLIRLIDSKGLSDAADRKRTDNGLKTDRKRTVLERLDPYPNPNPEKNTSCAKPEAGPAPPAVLTIPLVGKNGSGPPEYPITQADIAEWSAAFPAVDVLQTLRTLRQWNLSNPTRQKTARGIRRHITQWLAKEQDRGGCRPRAADGPTMPRIDDQPSLEEALR